MSYCGSTKALAASITLRNVSGQTTLSSNSFSVNDLKITKNGCHAFGNGSTTPSFNKEIKVVSGSIVGSATSVDNVGLYLSNTSNASSRACSQLSGNNASTASYEKYTASDVHNIMQGLPTALTGKCTTNSGTRLLVNDSVFSVNFVLKD